MAKIVILNSSSYPVIVRREEVKKHNENHDELGRFAPADGSSASSKEMLSNISPAWTQELFRDKITVYHGTSSEALAGIKEHGLVPHGGKGADEWARGEGVDFSTYDVGDRAVSVFVTTESKEAAFYAKAAAKVTGGEPVTIVAKIPKAEFSGHHSSDKLDDAPGSQMYRGTIKPEWITGVVRVSKAKTISLYLVVVAKEDVAKMNENHDELGRFSSGDGGGTMSAFHGTTDKALENIMKEGIVFPKSAGDTNFQWNKELTAGDRNHSVYVVDSLDKAEFYASTAAQTRGGEAIIFEVTVPRSAFIKDERDPSSFRSNTTIIKPEWITKAYQLKRVEDKFSYKDKDWTEIPLVRKQDGVTIYLVINSKDYADPVEKFNQNHDEKGRFASGDGGSGDRAWGGKSEAGPKISKQETGRIGEQVAIDFLKKAGIEDVRHLNSDQNNYPVDLAGDHQLIEVKTGLATNGESAQQWRATIGEPGPTEKEWLKGASREEKAAWNSEKSQAIMDRKNGVLDSVGKQTGMKLKGTTVGVILNPSTKRADVYVFEGFHSRISWKSPMAAKAYKGTVSYG